MKLSIVIPAFNESSTIVNVLEAVERTASGLAGIIDHELIVVDDGSTDDTVSRVREVMERIPGIRLLEQSRNMGKGASIRRAFSEIEGDIVIIQDADLEYNPGDYSAIIRPIVEGNADVVYGSRFKGDTMRVLFFWHYVGNRFLTLLSNMLTNLNLSDMETGYKVFHRNVIDQLDLVSNRFGIEPEITAKVSRIPNVRIYEVPVSYFGRTYAEGKKIGWKDGVSAIWCILRFNIFQRGRRNRQS